MQSTAVMYIPGSYGKSRGVACLDVRRKEMEELP